VHLHQFAVLTRSLPAVTGMNLCPHVVVARRKRLRHPGMIRHLLQVDPAGRAELNCYVPGGRRRRDGYDRD